MRPLREIIGPVSRLRPERAEPSASRAKSRLLAAATLVAALLSGTVETQNAVANGDTRTLSLFHLHTKESATITFKRDGRYDRAALEQLNWLLRDWRENESTRMDPLLFDTVWEAQRSIGSTQPLQIVCGYRSPATNGMLRRRSRGVANESQHTLGKAMDFFIPDASLDDLRAAGMRLQRGGVGWYPRSGSPFVHLDVGSVRAWPRMTQDQLARLFPDGKTVHLASNGKMLAKYEQARSEILARGGTVQGLTTIARGDIYDGIETIKDFFAGMLDGGSASTARKDSKSVAVASADPDAIGDTGQALAYLPPESTDILREAMLRRDGKNPPSARELLTGMAAGSNPAAVAVIAPLPPRRPAEFAEIEAALAMPIAPERPAEMAAQDTPAADAVAVTEHAEEPRSDPMGLELRSGTNEPDDQLRSLFQPSPQSGAEPASRAAPVHVALVMPKVDPVPPSLLSDRPSAEATRFSEQSPGDALAASHFSAASPSEAPAGD